MLHRLIVCPVLVAAFALSAHAQLTFNPAWTANGDQGASWFGYSVASVGDVNGDGFDDAIVGEPEYSNGQTWEGKAFVFFGSTSGLSTTPSWATEGNASFKYYGNSVAGAGDVNGDGFDDVIVGSIGTAYLYLGSASGLATASAWTADGGSDFGREIGGAGDVNGDGFADVLVAAPHDGGASRVYVFYGSSLGLPAVASTQLDDPTAGTGFGISATGAGDVNGDGYADVIVGDPWLPNGAAYVFLGSAAGIASAPAWSAQGDVGSNFGYSVANAGDVDADGYADVIVGAPNHNRVLIYRGSPAGLALQPTWDRAPGNGGAFGNAVAAAGDVNGDGYGDVLVGAKYYGDNPAGNTSGRLFVYLGGPAGLEELPSWYGGHNTNTYSLGLSVDGGGDFDGDGFADVIGGGGNSDNGTQFAVAFHGGTHASAAPYGQGKTALSKTYPPRLMTAIAPSLGGTGKLDLLGGVQFVSPYFLFAGFQPAALPFDSGTLLVLPFTVLITSYPVNVPIPALPVLQDFDVYFQGGHVDPQTPGYYHTALSNGVRWRLGT